MFARAPGKDFGRSCCLSHLNPMWQVQDTTGCDISLQMGHLSATGDGGSESLWTPAPPPKLDELTEILPCSDPRAVLPLHFLCFYFPLFFFCFSSSTPPPPPSSFFRPWMYLLQWTDVLWNLQNIKCHRASLGINSEPKWAWLESWGTLGEWQGVKHWMRLSVSLILKSPPALQRSLLPRISSEDQDLMTLSRDIKAVGEGKGGLN